MIIASVPLAGAFLITPEPAVDERGAFGRLFCAQTFTAAGLNPRLDQISYSFNLKAGTLRGLHLQRPPNGEAKLIRVTQGAIFDVIVDVRAASPTFGRSYAVVLEAADRRQLYLPVGIAHGFQTLTDAAEITYHISTPYAAEAQDGVRWDDPDLAINWPDPDRAILSARDRQLPLLADFKPVIDAG